MGVAIYNQFYKELEHNTKSAPMGVPTELHQYEGYSAAVLLPWLSDVAQCVYTDILTKKRQFQVGVLGSIWYDAVYTGKDNIQRLTRVALVGVRETEADEVAQMSFQFILDPSIPPN